MTYHPGGHIFTSRPGKVYGQLLLRLLSAFHICVVVCWSVRSHLWQRNNYVIYTLAMWLYFSPCRQLLSVATMNNLAQLWVLDGNQEAEAM